MISNHNKLSVTILGSGTCVPSLKRSSCSVLMRTDDNNLLFDSGAGTMKRLLEAGVEIFDVSFIFYSHFHPDHTSELVPFLFSNKYPDGSRRKRPLTLVAGNGFLKFYENLKFVYGHWIELDTDLLKIMNLTIPIMTCVGLMILRWNRFQWNTTRRALHIESPVRTGYLSSIPVIRIFQIIW